MIINPGEQKQEEHLLIKSTIDDLTGALNKRAFECVVSESLKKKNKSYLYMVDLDDFKEVNDRFGHLEGDELLIKIGQLLRDIFKKDVIGRVGGDEFMIYSESVDPVMYAKRVLHETTKLSSEKEYSVSVSVGITGTDGVGSGNYQKLFAQADQAMHCAKQEGKNRIIFFEEN